MIKRLTSQLPDWARPNHPILQYELAHLRQMDSWQIRVGQVLVIALLLGLGGYLYATYIYESSTKGNITDLAWRTLYFPTLLVQVITSIIALSLGIGSIGQERSKRTWDNLRVTEVGAGLILKTRWIAILYRLRAPIMAILLVRFILLLGLLYDIMAFGGHYPDMLTNRLIPTIADERIGLLVISLIMTMSVLLPLTMIGASAGIGILISVAVKNRTYSATLQAILTIFQLLIVVGLLVVISQVLRQDLELTDNLLFALFMGYSSFGDWGLLFMQLGSVGEIWARVPYGIVIGVGLLLLVPIQSAITDAMLGLAVKLSESRE